MKNLIILIAILPLLGCTALKAKRVGDVLNSAADIADAVCAAAPLFELAEVPPPDKSQCEHALRALNSNEYKTLVKAYDCLTSNGTWLSQRHCLINETDVKSLAVKLSK